MNNLGIGVSRNNPHNVQNVQNKGIVQNNGIVQNIQNKGIVATLPKMGLVFSVLGKNQNPNLKDQGNCKWLQSAEQPVFGPYLWTAFHIIAINYPDEPTKPTQLGAINFIKGIPYMIPCANCGYHFKEFLLHDYLPSFNNNLNRKFHQITNSKNDLVTFFVEAHNNVTNKTNKVGKIWTTTEAKEYYNDGYRCVNPNVIPWEDTSLRRARNTKCKEYIKSAKDGSKQCKAYELI